MALPLHKLKAGIIAFGFVVGLICGGAAAKSGYIRRPVVAGMFYPDDPESLTGLINDLTRRAQSNALNIPSDSILKGLILPHAGYIYSGLTTAYAASLLIDSGTRKIILVGPDHRVGFPGIAVSEAEQFQTPLGLIQVHPDAARLRKLSPMFIPVIASDRQEHSLEVILPFLQMYLKDFNLVPMVVGQSPVEPVIDGVEHIYDSDTLLIVSSDLSHFLPYQEAVRTDQDTIESILKLDAGSISSKKNSACGALPIEVMIKMAHNHKWRPRLLNYRNSGDMAGDKTSVVGYAAIAFFGEITMIGDKNSGEKLTKEQGIILLKLARNTILESFDKKAAEKETSPIIEDLKDPVLGIKRGVFVTLKIDHELRGCIGNLSANESILSGVRGNALNAAFHDPRFRPLSRKELDNTDIEISILSDPNPLEYENAEDLASKLRPNIDGVILRKGSASATFLPQVWEQLPSPESFLSHLCMKAGLPADEWKSSRLTIMTYQVQYFEEEN